MKEFLTFNITRFKELKLVIVVETPFLMQRKQKSVKGLVYFNLHLVL